MTAHHDFLSSLYQSLLGREADAEGLAYWSDALESGELTPAEVVARFSASSEAVTEIVPVAQLYLLVFGRSPDAEGLKYWVNQVREGMTHGELATNFLVSAEFGEAFGRDLAPAELVSALFTQMLGREPDADGLAHFVAQLEQGDSPANVLSAISLSAEATARVADPVQTILAYVGVQGRPPLADELAEATAQLQAGDNSWLEAIVAEALPTPEPQPEPAPGPQPAPLPETAMFTVSADTAGGSSDASTAVALDDAYMIVGDDEASVLRVYPREGGEVVYEWDFGAQLGNGGELDLEASAWVGDVLYLVGSHGNKKDGDEADSREVIFAVSVSGTGAEVQFELLGQFTDLEAALVSWDIDNGHGLGQGALGLAGSSADGHIPEQVSGFSIEGMAASPEGDALWLGFRAPQLDTTTRDKALLVPVLDLEALRDGTLKTPTFGDPVMLDLGGRGIRSIERAEDGSGYLIVAGPSGGASAAVARDFRLFTWSGEADASPVELDNDLDALLAETGGSFETLVAPASIAEGTRIQLLQDNGDTRWPGQDEVSKDLPEAEQQFRGNWLELGAPFVDDDAPQLVQSTPAAGVEGAAVDGNLVLTFDEVIQAGEGVIELRTGDGEPVETFDVQTSGQVRFNGNELEVEPSEPLDFEAAYQWVVSAGSIFEAAGNPFDGLGDAAPLAFTTSAEPTELAAGDVMFVAGNAEAPDAMAFVLLKDVSGGTRIDFTDRDYDSEEGFAGITNEMVFVWTAGQNLPAGTVVTIQTDTDGNPLADIGSVMGEGGGVGKAETFYAMQGATIDGLTDGSAGEILVPGILLASLTLGGEAGDIPQTLFDVGAALAFTSDPANQTNARYIGSLDASEPAALAARIADPLNWEFNSTKAPGFELVDGSFFAMPLLRQAEVDEAILTLVWNQPLDAAVADLADAFTVQIQGETVAVNEVTIEGEAVSLTLSQAVVGGDLVNVSYTDPSMGDDDYALQSMSGVDVASFSLEAITNRSPDSEAPEMVSWSMAETPAGVLHFANLELEFNEVVMRGDGHVVFTPVGEGEAITVAAGSLEISLDGPRVTIDPEAFLLPDTEYEVTVEAGAFEDAAGNGFAGLALTDAEVVTAPAPSYELLITEVNSNAGPADFVEIYNFGETAIDLTDWRLTDDGAAFDAADTLTDGIVLEAGQALVVLMDKGDSELESFRSAWNLDDDVLVVALDGPGLGKGDAVLLFDSQGYLAAGFSYGADDVIASDGTVVGTAAYGGTSGEAQPDEHTGVVFGGAKEDSAVWDGLDLLNPAYVAAVDGELGAYVQTGADQAVGSPGWVPELGTDLSVI